jgi:hypothetical protein
MADLCQLKLNKNCVSVESGERRTNTDKHGLDEKSQDAKKKEGQRAQPTSPQKKISGVPAKGTYDFSYLR